MLHSDHSFVRKRQGYILVLMDNFSRKIMIQHCKIAKAFPDVKLLLEFKAKSNFSRNSLLVAVDGSNHCNDLLKLCPSFVEYTQKFSIAYARFTNVRL